MLQSGWVDIAASELDDIRRCIAPTLTLTTPYGIPSSGTPQVFLNSVATPWVWSPSAPITDVFGKPLGWPSTEAWPNVPVVGPHLASPASTGGFTSQRDRIIRGTFGPVNSSTQFNNAAQFGNLGLAAWPRAEKSLPNSDRGSEILAGGVLSNNCSSFQVDWTWERGTGKQADDTGAPLTAFYQLGNMVNAATMRGYEPDAGPWNVTAGDFSRQPRPQPWFGFPDAGWTTGAAVVPRPEQRMGVTLAQDPAAMPIYLSPPPPALPANSTNVHMQRVAQGIEGIPGHATVPAVQYPWGTTIPVVVYTAIFGFNQDQAYLVTPDGLLVMRDDFTPWPSQLRFTMTLHDPRLVLDRGREFQFVVDVPKRKK
jgi:hypothetical protein